MELREFREQETRLLNLMFELESDNDIDAPCSCGRGTTANMRCQECINFTPCCRLCICEAHVHEPFHWVQKYHQGFFVKEDLGSVGLVIFLGHGGERCKNMVSGRQSTSLTVVHHNGIHKSKVAWCDCLGCGDRVDQLMRARLFPATLTNPQTVFTFQMLNQAHVHILQSKKSSYDYIWSLQRLTNNVFTDDVPVS